MRRKWCWWQLQEKRKSSISKTLCPPDCFLLMTALTSDWRFLGSLALSKAAGCHCCSPSHLLLHKALLSPTESSCELAWPCVTLSYSASWALTSKGGTVAVQGSLLQVLPVEVVLGWYVVGNGSGLHHLHPINLYHWHLLEEQGSI